MKFCIDRNAKKISGFPVYRKKEYSFDFVPHQSADTSLLYCNLSLGFDSQTMQAKLIWGFHPYLGWIERKLTIPHAIEGGLLLEGTESSIQSGQIKRIVECDEWNTYIDPETGWICFGNCESMNSEIAVEFAENVIAVVNQGKIKAFWLKPTFE